MTEASEGNYAFRGLFCIIDHYKLQVSISDSLMI
jgi:hypothetical protein